MSDMKKYLIKEKTIARFIICFLLIALFAATPATGKSPSLTSNKTVNETQADLAIQKQALQKVLQKVMDMLFVFLESLEKREDIGLEEKMQKAVDFVRNIRWGPDNQYYFWIFDLDAKMIMEPVYPDMEGKNCIEYKDVNNKEIFVSFTNIITENGQGFVEHHGLGYNNNKSKPSITLVKSIEAWGWIIGTYGEFIGTEFYEEPVELKFLVPLPGDIEEEGPASPM